MVQLIKSFEKARYLQRSVPLSDDDIRRTAPSIFAESAHARCSERYAYIPTSQVLTRLRKEGFEPFMCAQSGCRSPGRRDYTRHMLRLRHRSQIGGGEEAREVILINSHDMSSAYQMLGGVFRFVCRNGLVCGDTLEDLRVSHRGNVVDRVVEGAYRLLEQFERVDGALEGMRALSLSPEERLVFGQAALALRYDDPAKAPITAAQVIEARRFDDTAGNLWTTLNTAQEHLLRGGVRGIHPATGKAVTTRPVQAIDGNVKLNRALWTLADGMRQLKEGGSLNIENPDV